MIFKFFILCFFFLTGCKKENPAKFSKKQFYNLFSVIFDRISSDYVVPLKNQEIYNAMLSGMLMGLDEFSRYIPENEYKLLLNKKAINGFGIEIDTQERFPIILNVYKNSPAERAGIKPFDKILEINSKRAILKNIKTLNEYNQITLVLERDNTTLSPIDLLRQDIKLESVSFTLEDGIAVIKIVNFNQGASHITQKILKSIQYKKIKGVVLDIRNNAGGIFDEGIKIAQLFINHGIITKVKYREDEEVYYANGKDWLDGVPIVVFVNKYSASASELLAGCLKDHGRALIVGEKTFGKGSMQSLIRLINNGAILLTTGYFYTPNGHVIHEKGITPHLITSDFENTQSFFK